MDLAVFCVHVLACATLLIEKYRNHLESLSALKGSRPHWHTASPVIVTTSEDLSCEMICQASLRQKVVPLSDRVILEMRSTLARPAAGKVFIQNERIRGCGMCGWYVCYNYIISNYQISDMDIIWMSRLGLGSGDFGVTSCQINVSNVSL